MPRYNHSCVRADQVLRLGRSGQDWRRRKSAVRRRIREEGLEAVPQRDLELLSFQEREVLRRWGLERWSAWLEERGRRTAAGEFRAERPEVPTVSREYAALQDAKDAFLPLWNRYREYLEEGDLDDANTHIAMRLKQIQCARNMRDFDSAVEALHKLRGKYVERVDVRAQVATVGQADATVDAMLERLEGSLLAAPEFPALRLAGADDEEVEDGAAHDAGDDGLRAGDGDSPARGDAGEAEAPAGEAAEPGRGGGDDGGVSGS